MPEIFEEIFDWVFVGEIENIKDHDIKSMEGVIKSKSIIDNFTIYMRYLF